MNPSIAFRSACLLALGLAACDPAAVGEADPAEIAATYTLTVGPEHVVVEVGATFDITIAAEFNDDVPVERFDVAYTVEEPVDVVIWAGAFVVFPGNVPIAGDKQDANSDTASFWMEDFVDEEISMTITGRCEREGDTTIEVATSRSSGLVEGGHRTRVPVTCTKGVSDEEPRVARVRYDNHQPMCAQLGATVPCGAGTQLVALELACIDPTLRPGGDPSLATDIECAGGLDWLGHFDAGLSIDRRNFAIFIDADRDATSGAAGSDTFGNDLSVHLAQVQGDEQTQVDVTRWDQSDPATVPTEIVWQCLAHEAGGTCDHDGAIVGGRISPFDGFELTLGLRFDLQIDGFEGDLIYSDLPPRMGTFSGAEEAGFEVLGVWDLQGAPDLQAFEYHLQRIVD